MFLDTLEVHHLWFTCVATTTVQFGVQAGAQLRGALWETLQTSGITDTDLFQRLMRLETPQGARGMNPARPFSVRPPLSNNPMADRVYRPGDSFTFGLNLFGTMIDLFPYIVQAVYKIGQGGVGYQRHRGKGQFTLQAVNAVNPLTQEDVPLLEKQRIIGLPAIPVTNDHVTQYANKLPQESISLRFLTPTQLRDKKKGLLNPPPFENLIARLLERCQMIADNYTDISPPQSEWRKLYLARVEDARTIHISHCDTHWINVRGGSRRDNSGKKMSGFIGNVTYSGMLAPFISWLIWGQSLQVGKNTVKGNGWYTLV